MQQFGSSTLAMRREERAAASRQKSCNACVRGKRRCDKRAPCCSRCAAKGLDCVYQRMPPGSSTGSGSPDAPEVADVPDFDMGFDMDSLSADTSPESLHADHLGLPGINSSQLNGVLDPAMDFSIVDLLTGTSSGSETGFWDLQAYADPKKMEIPPVPTMPSAHHRQPIRDLSALTKTDNTCECPEVDTLSVYDPRSRVGYVVGFLNSMPQTFSQTRVLPFIHSCLWATHAPKTIMAAFSATTAYTNRTADNKAWTIRLLMDTAKEIHREGERAETSTEKLARLQALLLINSIRIFDGDIGLRAAAEREMSIMTVWQKDLMKVIVELENGETPAATTARDRPPKTWEDWILLESARRVALVSGAFMCITALLRGVEPDAEFWSWNKAFTASKHLWEAKSSAEFYRSWREHPQYCITNFNFHDVWMYAREADLDSFAKLMLASQVGLDAFDHFLQGETAAAT